jgi:hypothetical protein
MAETVQSKRQTSKTETVEGELESSTETDLLLRQPPRFYRATSTMRCHGNDHESLQPGDLGQFRLQFFSERPACSAEEARRRAMESIEIGPKERQGFELFGARTKEFLESLGAEKLEVREQGNAYHVSLRLADESVLAVDPGEEDGIRQVRFSRNINGRLEQLKNGGFTLSGISGIAFKAQSNRSLLFVEVDVGAAASWIELNCVTIAAGGKSSVQCNVWGFDKTREVDLDESIVKQLSSGLKDFESLRKTLGDRAASGFEQSRKEAREALP